ncbi:MAG: flagellar basal body L-ring protein FlgH [Magnetococcales bacterium]|nr:flagellar basal body L-ring protein FlgH [Magnetococcales bacterium]
MKVRIAIPIMMTAAVILTACGAQRASLRPPTPVAVVNPTPPEALAPKKGSIWQSSSRNTLFQDNKARNIGDLVTVSINETSSATNSADTKLERTGDTNFTLATPATNMFAIQNLINSTHPLNRGGMTVTNDHEGKGETSRSSTFKTSISCVVTEVLPNGALRIEGRRDITINHENQFIILSGIVRTEDINASNTVESTKIADARIEYSGSGDLNEQQRPGWLNRLFSVIKIL